MKLLASVPLLGFVLLLATIVAFMADGFDQIWFEVGLPSGATLAVTSGYALVLIGLVLLYVEIFKATRTGQASILDHVLSLVVFVIALLAFVIAPRFGHQAFLVLLLMMLIDVIAGFTVTISSARRDFGAPGA
jgi:hypothetical protein